MSQDYAEAVVAAQELAPEWDIELISRTSLTLPTLLAWRDWLVAQANSLGVPPFDPPPEFPCLNAAHLIPKKEPEHG